MFDRQRIERAGFEEALRQMPAGVIIVEAPSGEIISVNRQAEEIFERYLGRSVPSELGDLRELYDSGSFETFYPDERPYEMEEWPLIRSIRDGEEVRDEEIVHLPADGSQFTLRCNSSSIYDDERRIVAGVAVFYDITEQKRAEEALRVSNRRTENILDSITDEFSTVDREWRYTYMNERALARAQRAMGEELAREELLGKNIWELLPNLVDSALYQELHRALREQKTVEFEAYSLMSDRWVEVHAYPSEEGLSLHSQDITERKKAEEQVAYHARLLENINDAVLATDDQFALTAWNKGAEQMFGWTADEVLGHKIYEVIPTEYSDEEMTQALRDLSETGRFRGDMIMCHKDGTPVYTEALTIALRGEQGEITGYLNITRDITERKQAQEEIETRTRQQAVLAELGLWALANKDLQSLMNDAIALVAQTLEVEYSKIVELLPSGEELLLRAGVGWREGLVGSVMEGAGLDSQAGYTLRLEEPVIVEDLSTETRFRPPPLLHEHGVVSSMTVVIAGRGGPFGVLGVHTEGRRTFSEDDVNFLQAAANMLALLIEREEAEQKIEEVREAERSRIGRDLHDEALRDLSYALVEAQQLLRSISTDQEAARRAQRLLAALDRIGPQLRAVIYDLSLEGEQDKPFSELLESLLELQRTMAPDGCEITLNLRDEVLEGPLGQVGREVLRIVGEAVTNARRHSGAENVRVAVWMSEDENNLWVEVSDDGRGFDPAQEKLSTTTRRTGTKGMRERARLLGGDLKIESEPGQGTKVSLEMPLHKETEEHPQEEEVRILLVDDHTSIREALASAFEREAGFKIAGQAGSLAEARRMLEEVEEVEVAVVDLGLPDGYGADLIPELRATSPRAQALVLSASLDRTEIARSVERGAAGILHKTAHLDEVVEAVKRLRRGETLLPLEEVVALLRLAGSEREQQYEARQTIASLTLREREVLQALAEGLDSEQIADKLHISLRTERNHMASILAKLGVHSQLQALVFAVRQGLVEIS